MALHLEWEERIQAPADRVFAALTDLDGAIGWMPALVRIEKLTPGPVSVGSRWREVRRMFAREAAEEFEVRALEPGRELELYVDGTKGASHKGYYRFRYSLEREESGTRLRLSGEIGGMGWLGEWLGRLFVGPFRRAVAADLSALKRYLESGSMQRAAPG